MLKLWVEILVQIKAKTQVVNSQKLLDHAKQSTRDALKTASKRAIQKTAEATGHLIGNKSTDRNYKVLKLNQKIIQKQMKKKYLEKDLYLQI